MRICIVGDLEDLSAAYIGWLAKKRGANVLVLPEEDFGVKWTFRVQNDIEKSALIFNDSSVSLVDVDGAFVRLNPKPSVSVQFGVPEEVEHIYALERWYGIHWLLDQAPFPVINRPCAGRSNSSKPYQMLLLEKAGFQVPPWTATNDHEVAANFIASCPNGAVYKASSGLRCQVRHADQILLDRMAKGTSPAVLQQYIPGVDVRIHVVGLKTFATEIKSHAVDYRFDGGNTKYFSLEAPTRITNLCVEMTNNDRLSLSGFDFRRTDDDVWWCLEMNPVPTFLPYEASTGHPIGDAILDFIGEIPGRGHTVSPLFELVKHDNVPDDTIKNIVNLA